LFPIALQSWQRYALASGKCWSIRYDSTSPDLLEAVESIFVTWCSGDLQGLKAPGMCTDEMMPQHWPKMLST